MKTFFLQHLLDIFSRVLAMSLWSLSRLVLVVTRDSWIPFLMATSTMVVGGGGGGGEILKKFKKKKKAG